MAEAADAPGWALELVREQPHEGVHVGRRSDAVERRQSVQQLDDGGAGSLVGLAPGRRRALVADVADEKPFGPTAEGTPTRALRWIGRDGQTLHERAESVEFGDASRRLGVFTVERQRGCARGLGQCRRRPLQPPALGFLQTASPLLEATDDAGATGDAIP